MHNPNTRCRDAAIAALTLTLAAVGLPSTAASQTAAPRTPWGAPDLNGIWSHGTATPLERPEEQGDRELLTEGPRSPRSTPRNGRPRASGRAGSSGGNAACRTGAPR